jgi:hypothetical protein
MTIDDLLLQMRDIRSPPVEAGTGGGGISWTPLAVFASVVLLTSVVAYWRRQRWLRDTRRQLNEVHRLPEPIARWQALVGIALDVALHRGQRDSLPDCVYIPGARARPEDFARIEGFVHRATRNWFGL